MTEKLFEKKTGKYGNQGVFVAARKLRRELSYKFLRTRFFIRIGYCGWQSEWVDVRWKGEPTQEKVEKIAKKYGTFNGVLARGNRHIRCKREPDHDKKPKTIQTKLCSEKNQQGVR